MAMQKTMKDLLKTGEMIILPETYDVASTRCAELCGFKAAVISSGELSMAMNGNPDMGLLTVDDLVWLCEKLCMFAKIPVIVDAEGGFGRPLNAYNTANRLARCGIGGLIITDESEPYLSLRDSKAGVCTKKEGTARMRAAVLGLEGTDAILISRTDVDITKDFDEVVERCCMYREAGADATMVLSLNRIRDLDQRMEVLRKLAEQVTGPKWYPDLSSKEGRPDLDLDALAKLGYQMVGVHFMIAAATYGMVEAGRQVARDRNSLVLDRNMDALPEAAKVLDGTVPKAAYIDAFGLTDGTWLELERKFFDEDFLFAAKSYRMAKVMTMLEKNR